MTIAKWIRRRSVCLVLASMIAVPWAWAREAENPESAQPVRTIPIKAYTPLKAVAVWKVASASDKVLVDVRFKDTFDRLSTSVPAAAREIRIGADTYRIAVMMTTETDLSLLVPVEQTDTLEKVKDFKKGRQFGVEGTVLGSVAGRECVLVDRILTEVEDKSVIKYELTLTWPGTGAKAKKLIAPGEYNNVEFPCRYAKDMPETFIVVIEQKTREQLDKIIEQREKAAAEAAAKKAAEAAPKKEGKEEKPAEKPPEPSAPKSYATYRGEEVYKYAVTGTKLNVLFKDTIRGGAAPSRDIKTVPPRLAMVRLSADRPIKIGLAFDTYLGLTCIVPADNKKLMARASSMLPGLDVTIRGMILQPAGAYKVVLVDDIDFPQDVGQAEIPDVWVVTIFWDPQRPKVFYEPGKYPILFACRNVADKKEELQAELEAKREILQAPKEEKKDGAAEKK